MCTLSWVVALYFTNGPHCGKTKGSISEAMGCVGATLSFLLCIATDIYVLTLLRKATGY